MSKFFLDATGAVVNAAIAKVISAFNASTGHGHTADTDDAPPIGFDGLDTSVIKLISNNIDDLNSIVDEGIYICNAIPSENKEGYKLFVIKGETPATENGVSVWQIRISIYYRIEYRGYYIPAGWGSEDSPYWTEWQNDRTDYPYNVTSNPTQGKQAFNFDTNKPVWYNGSQWSYADGTTVI